MYTTRFIIAALAGVTIAPLSVSADPGDLTIDLSSLSIPVGPGEGAVGFQAAKIPTDPFSSKDVMPGDSITGGVQPQAVPLPTGAALGLVGLGMIGARRRRRA